MSTKGLPFPTPLTEKYQPRRVQDFIGLARQKRELEAFIKNPFVHRFFFLGGSGLGKTALAQAVAREINAQLEEVPSAQCDLERVERIARMCQCGAFNFWGPNKGTTADWHLIAVHETHSMTPKAQDAFLSLMDSTAAPPRTIFIFTGNSIKTLEAPFLSRCQVLDFTADSMKGELEPYLAKVYKKEGGKYPLDFEGIAKSAQYNVRDALNMLQSELFIGANRKGLPTKELQINPEHTHKCKGRCGKPWKHADEKCDLPYRAVCPQCGGSSTAGEARAKKAWVTIKKNIEAELTAKKKKGKAA